GTPVTADNLETLLRLCAEHLGGDYKPESESWGDGAAGRFMREAAGTSLYDEAVRVLCGFLTDGNPDQVKMAAGLIPAKLTSPSAIIAAMQRHDLDASTSRQLRAALGRTLSLDVRAYEPRFRSLVGQPGWESLMGAFLIADHEWIFDHLHAIFGEDPAEAANRLWFGVLGLNAAEAAALRDELDAHRAELGEACADALLDYLDDEIKSGTFKDRPGPVRWATP
ncbi:MAG TPA: hypothetical protein VII38_23885, partial [Polyangia bacterium]